MKILSLSYEDLNTNWKLENCQFDDLTLLVGASGVGKTQILQAILALKDIASGQMSDLSIKWSITFDTKVGSTYKWSGKLESTKDYNFFVKHGFTEENIYIDDKPMIQRSSKGIFFLGEETIKLPFMHSVIYSLQEEETIKPIFDAFSKIILSEHNQSWLQLLNKEFDADKLSERYKTLENIQLSKESILTKLYLTHKIGNPIVKNIKETFINIFPNVEDVSVDYTTDHDEFNAHPCIHIKEDDTWIQQDKISSGMLKTLIQISEIYLCNEGSVFLIDEFENSLGANCIDELTKTILSTDRQLQFILTSHHPYIINNISHKNWKIVTRDKGVVRTHNAEKFNIGKSKHQAFMQLMQLDAYQTGMMSSDSIDDKKDEG